MRSSSVAHDLDRRELLLRISLGEFVRQAVKSEVFGLSMAAFRVPLNRSRGRRRCRTPRRWRSCIPRWPASSTSEATSSISPNRPIGIFDSIQSICCWRHLVEDRRPHRGRGDAVDPDFGVARVPCRATWSARSRRPWTPNRRRRSGLPSLPAISAVSSRAEIDWIADSRLNSTSAGIGECAGIQAIGEFVVKLLVGQRPGRMAGGAGHRLARRWSGRR